VVHPNTGNEQFYSGGVSIVTAPPGDYQLKVFKGLEYRVATQQVRIEAGRATEAKVVLQRWSNLPKQGWYGSDSHLHIGRPLKELNTYISKWMQAEDIHVANLLQWGNSKRFHNTIQYAHGPDSLYHDGDYWLASGQENPRTHFLGHTLTLGARTPIDYRDDYLNYKKVWDESRRQEALSGYCHYAITRGAEDGLAIDLLDNLLSVIEVAQFNRGVYQVWYDCLNLGFRIAPIAGTDYPCVASLPGQERFYTRVEGPLGYPSWLEGVRRGRTFVTNGPMLSFNVNGKPIGDEVSLKKAGLVTVEASVRFDPERDDVTQLDIIENGTILRSFSREGKAAEIRCQFRHEVSETSWLAARASGIKRGVPFPRLRNVENALAHSAAIYVTVIDMPALGSQRRAQLVAAAWLERLDGLEKQLAEDRLPALAKWPLGDGVDLDDLRKQRSNLLQRIQLAKKRFQERLRP
jgi:hypothetical protein